MTLMPAPTQIRAKPFLKWVGGKGRLLGQFEQYLPSEYGTYFEPFLGGGALFFHLSPRHSVVNDINANLIEVYEIIKDQPEQLIARLKEIEEKYLTLEQEERKEKYYQARKIYNSGILKGVDRASYLIFLNKTCFNGLYRENQKGEFNVPPGAYKTPLICDRSNILATSTLLKNAKILSGTFQDAVQEAQENDFVYFDPPYHPLNETSNFTNYSNNGFTGDDQVTLRDTFVELDKKGCKVMLSNSNTDFIKELYINYRVERVMASRAVNCKAEGRGKIAELVVLNY